MRKAAHAHLVLWIAWNPQRCPMCRRGQSRDGVSLSAAASGGAPAPRAAGTGSAVALGCRAREGAWQDWPAGGTEPPRPAAPAGGLLPAASALAGAFRLRKTSHGTWTAVDEEAEARVMWRGHGPFCQ